MRPQTIAAALSALPLLVAAVFQDEVGHIDYFHELLGLPQPETTFFHRPRLDDKASLLYTLSDVGVLGAVNPSSGAVVWRQWLSSENATDVSTDAGHLRAGSGESWVASAYGNKVQAWSAGSGRNIWTATFDGQVKDMEVMEVTENGRKDVLALFQEDGAVVLRRLHGNEGHVVWEFRETNKDLALQVSDNVKNIFVVSLHGSSASYSVKVAYLDTLTGKKLDENMISVKGDVRSEQDVMFVGANSAAPIVAWTDSTFTKLKINVLGTKNRQEFALGEGTTSVEIHAPSLPQSQPHFLVHGRTALGGRAEVYHVDLKTNAISKAYDLPHVSGASAFATSSSDGNVYFTRVTDDQITLTASTSHGVLGKWELKTGASKVVAIQAVAEVIKKAGDQYAIRVAAVADSDDWALLQNGNLAWTRPEGLSGAVAAAFAEIPEAQKLADALDQEAHSNPLSAYMHRLKRHIDDMQNLPDYLASTPLRIVNSILGTDITAKTGLSRDSFGFHKIVVLATRRGRVYGLDTGSHGDIIWSTKAYEIAAGQHWDVKGLFVDNTRGVVTIRGADGEQVVVAIATGAEVEKTPMGSWPAVESTALADSPAGQWLVPIGKDGKVGNTIPAAYIPKQIVVARGPENEVRGLKFVQDGAECSDTLLWEFVPPAGQRIAHIASRPAHDPVASIGRVLGDRSVLYKYLNPNTIVVSALDDAVSTLTTYLIDTVSGQVLASSTSDGVDTTKPTECTMSENWFICSYFASYPLASNPKQSITGYHLTVTDLYESAEADDRGPLGASTNFSSLNPVDSPVPVTLPSAISQSWVFAAPISALAVSQTRQGISTRQLLAYLPTHHGIIGLPKAIFEPRRPVGRAPTPAELEEGLVQYAPAVEVDPKMMLSHSWDVIGVKKILASPAIVESTSLVFAFGIDVFGTRVAPSFTFDILGKGFGKLSLIGTVIALFAGVFALGPMVRKKQIDTRWKAQM